MGEREEKTPYIRVMLVDDDQLLLEDIRHLVDWNSLGFEIVGVFGNGQAAFKHLQPCRPDFIITDIKMPCMDGLTFAARVRDLMPRVQMLLLTAYTDFDYAKQAIRLGVSNYILKYDLTRESLTEELHKVKRIFCDSRNTAALSCQQRLEQFLIKPDDLKAREQLTDILGQYPLPVWGLMALASPVGLVNPEALQIPAMVNKECCRIRDSIRSFAAEGIAGEEHREDFFGVLYRGKRVVVLVLLEEECKRESRYLSRMHELVSDFLRKFDESGERRPNILYMPYGAGTLDQLYQGFSALDRCISYTLFAGTGKAGDYEELRIKIREQCYSLKEMEAIGQKLSGMAASGIIRLLEPVYQQFCRDSYSLSGFHQLLQLIDEAARQLRRQGLCSEEQVQSCLQQCTYSKNVEDVWVCFEEFMEKIQQTEKRGYSVRIKKTLQFIHEHYGEEISIQDAAEQLGFNSEYLNKLFKKELGLGFSRYLTSYRMEQAKRLLASGEYRVGEVAELVGFKSSQYFSVAFRQIMGVAPSEFIKY